MSDGSFVKGVWVPGNTEPLPSPESKKEPISISDLEERVLNIESYLGDLHHYIVKKEEPCASKWEIMAYSLVSVIVMLVAVEIARMVL